MATLKELSEQTGYSAATISRILNGDETLSVTDETRRIVLEEVARMGYTSNRGRRHHTNHSSLNIAIAERHTPAEQVTEPYYLFLSNYVRQSCMDSKYSCVIMDHSDSLFSLSTGVHVDGIAAIGDFSGPQIESLTAYSKNIVLIDTMPFDSPYDFLNIDFNYGISLALNHLFDLGHRKICFLGPSLNRQGIPEPRYAAFTRIMREKNLLEDNLLLDVPTDIENAYHAVIGRLKDSCPAPTAFLCSTEESAIGAIYGIKKTGLSVPQDISVLSFDNTPKSTLVDPALTSISVHVEETARIAVRMLAERASLNGNPPVRKIPLHVTIPPSLEIRSSTARQEIN